MATHVHSSSQKLHSSYARIIIACICGTWTACCIHFTSILLAILRKHIRYNGVRLIKLIQVRRNNLCQHDIFGTFLKSIWRCNTIYSYFGQNLFFISYNRYYQFLWQSPASENSIPWKEKKLCIETSTEHKSKWMYNEMRFGEHKYKTLQFYQCNTCAYIYWCWSAWALHRSSY